MVIKKRRFPRSKTNFKNKPGFPDIKPGADAGLKKIFTSIGVPDKTPFKPDPFQLDAVSAINKGDCLVTAPTGSGKTWIAEQAIARTFGNGKKSWYAAPLKALSNSKYSEFSEIFGAENVGILTGDRKENPDAPVIVGTTEILRNQLYDAMYHGTELAADLVVLDEAHFLGDEERGVVWEEIMIYLPARIPLLMLSATIGNANQIAKWLSSIRSKECVIIEETKRPVPLFPVFFHPSGTLFPMVSPKISPGDYKGGKKIYKKVENYINKKRPFLLAPPHKLPPFGKILGVLKKYNLLPVIFFLKSRADCDNAIELCLENVLHDSDRKTKLGKRIEELVMQNSYIARHRQLGRLEHTAVGAHHSGQLPSWKLVLETLMTEGLLDAIFATSTVAAGVNFPARTVVFFNSDRFNGKEFLPLNPTEFHQMTGRAGRRGMDNIGFAVAVPGKFMDIRLIVKLLDSPPSDVESQIRINFSMALNLLLSHSPGQTEELLEKSFATNLITEKRTGLITQKRTGKHLIGYDHKFLWQDFLRHFNFLEEKGYVTKEGELTGDGIWASKLRIDHPLMVAESLRIGLLPKTNSALLTAIIASFVDEREPDDKIDKKFLPKELLDRFYKVKRGLEPFAKLMTNRGFEVKSLFLRPAAAIYAWASGHPWEDVLAVSEIEEGNLVMLILRTADNLRHIRALAKAFPEVAETASKSMELIMRVPVVMDY